MDYFLLVGHIYIKDMDHQMSFKRHTNNLISFNHAWFMETFPFLIFFTKSITILKVSICYKYLDSYNRKSLILIL
jgi:hypothetical protein